MNDSKASILRKTIFTLVLAAGLLVIGMHFGIADSVGRYYSQLMKLLQVKKQEVESLVAARAEVDKEVVYQFNLERLSSSGGLRDLNSTDKYVEETSAQQELKLEPGQVSYYQAYVTPDDVAVQAVAKGKSYEAIYKEAVSWVWVEDKILNGMEEKWLLPKFFLIKTPNLASNPVKGSIASDCEEKAYTLVSILRAAGMPSENVRVVTGQVNFGGSIGGHAWVELFDESTRSWFQLDATSGNYYNSDTNSYFESSGLPYAFFKTYQYPSVEIWTYFNDKYFWDNNRQQGTVAGNWLTTETVAKQVPQSQVIYELPDKVHRMREERIRTLQKEIESLDNQELMDQLKKLQRERRQQENQVDPRLKSSTESSSQQQEILAREQVGPVVVVGRIDQVDSDTITVTTRFGLLAVTFSSDTVISGASPTSIDAVEHGMFILVEGEWEENRKIRAKAIQIITP